MHHYESENSCRDIIEHDSGAFGKSLQLAHRRRLEDIERSEKYKTREKSFPCQGDGDEGDELSGDLVDYDELWVFSARGARYARGGGDSDQRDQNCQFYGNRGSQLGGKFVCERGPNPDRGG
jgi:hypothetical protein